MQQFLLSKCSRKNQTRVCLKCFFLYKMYFKNLWFVLLKSKLMLSQIHVLGGSSVAGLGNMGGGGFVFFKHYHRQCNRWLDYVASYPSKPSKIQHFCFPFWFCLNFLLFLFVDCFGYLTLYNCIHVYRAGDDMTLTPPLLLRCTYLVFPLRLDVIFFTEWGFLCEWNKLCECLMKRKRKTIESPILSQTQHLTCIVPAQKMRSNEWMCLTMCSLIGVCPCVTRRG